MGAKRMQGHRTLGLFLAVAVLAGCHTTTSRPKGPGPAATNNESTAEGIVVGDDKTSIEAAIEGGSSASSATRTETTEVPSRGIPLADNAPDSYVVKRGDTLWGIAKVFLRDPWFWPEIWQVNPQVHNPHLIYPGDTLRLVYIDGRPQIVLQRGELERGNGVRVEPRVRSEPLDAAITTIPYATVAAFMSKPSVLDREQIKLAPYILATRDLHVVMSEGDTIYARGFTSPAELGSHYNVVRVGDPLIDPDDNRVLGYDGIFTGSGHVTRAGEDAVIPKDTIVVRIDQRIADTHHIVMRAEFRRARETARVNGISFGHDNMQVAGREDIGREFDLFPIEHAGLRHECGHRCVRNGGDGCVERLAADARFNPDAVAALQLAALQHDLRPAVDIDQAQSIAGVNQMRVVDLGIDLPDLRPEPGIPEENFGDAPQGIAALHHIAVGRIVGQRDTPARHFGRFGARGGGSGGTTLNCRLDRRLIIADHDAFCGGLIVRSRRSRTFRPRGRRMAPGKHRNR